MLGRDYPGYYAVGDERALARLVARTHDDPRFYAQLRRATAARRPLFSPTAERRGLMAVVREATA